MTDRPATTDQQPLVYGGVIPTPHTADHLGRVTDPADERMRDLADQRAEDFVNNLTGRAEQEHIRKVIAEAVRKAVPMHSGGWVTANNVLDALDREGYTVAPRASVAAGDAQSLTPDVGAAQGGKDGSAAESEPRVHYEVEVFRSVKRLGKRSWRLSASPRDHENAVIVAAEIAANTGYRTRIVRVAREVIQ